MRSDGVPAKYSLVQKERLAICEDIQAYWNRISSGILFPLLWQIFTGSFKPANLTTSLM